MSRAGLLILAALPGCMTLDGLILPEHRVDEYHVSTAVIPEDRLEWVQFHADDGTELWGVWAHQPTSTDDTDGADAPVLLDIHGNGGAIGDNEWKRVEAHWQWGFEVFTFDYRGYGRSGGEAERDGIYLQDGQAAARYVAETAGLAPEAIPWIGLSLGGAIAIHANADVPARAVVLEETFASTDQLIEEGVYLDLPSGWAFDQAFDNAADIGAMQSPVYVIHGLADDFVAPSHGDTLFHNAPDNPKWLWHPEGVHHTDITEVMPDEYRRRVLAFLADPTQDPNRPAE